MERISVIGQAAFNYIYYKASVPTDKTVIVFAGSVETYGSADGSYLTAVERYGYPYHALKGYEFPFNIIAIQHIKGVNDSLLIIPYLKKLGFTNNVMIGFSQGGLDVIKYLTKYNGRDTLGIVKGFVSISGTDAGTPDYCLAEDKPVLCVHGEKDTSIYIKHSEDIIKKLQACTTRVSSSELIRVPNTGHSCSWAYTPDPNHSVFKFIMSCLNTDTEVVAPSPVREEAKVFIEGNEAIFVAPSGEYKIAVNGN